MISILILTKDRPSLLAKCLESIDSQSLMPDEIIVLNNGGADDSAYELCRRMNNCRFFSVSNNIGCIKGRNYLVDLSRGDYLLFVDDDGTLSNDTIRNCMNYFRLLPNTGVVTFRIIDPVSGTIKDGISDYKSFYHYTFGGGSCCMRRSVFKKIGKYVIDYPRQGEEHDFAIRLINAGYDIIYAFDCILYHPISNLCNDLFVYAQLAPITTSWRLMPIPYALFRTISNFYKIIFRMINGQISWSNIPALFFAIHKGFMTRKPISHLAFMKWFQLWKLVKRKMVK